MISTFSGLNTSKLGLFVNQKSLYTTGHNIANADTQGYSRQRVSTVTTNSITLQGKTIPYQLGTGVDMQSVTRVRDFLVDRQLWKQTATYGYYEQLNSVHSTIETIFTEPSDTNFQATLDKFWTSVQNVASNPADAGCRTTMRQSAVDMVDIIQTTSRQLGDEITSINESITKNVNRINQISTELLSLNKQIVMSEINGAMANDLRDRRDTMVDELSKLVRTNVNEDEKGNYQVSVGGQVIVDGVMATKLLTYENKNTDLYKNYGYRTLDVRTDTVPSINVTFTDGAMSGLLEGRDSDKQGVLAYMNMLNDISKSLLCDFNQIHKEGLGLDNSAGLNFFGSQDVQYAGLPAVTNPITGLPEAAVPGFDPATSGANNAEKNWIHYLKVNDIFFDPLSGLDKIAAKTLSGNIEIALSTANRVNSAKVSAGAPADQAAISFVGQSTMVFKGPSASNIQIKAGSMNADGFMEDATYSLDGGATWLNADVNIETGTNRLVLRGTNPYEYNIEVQIEKKTADNQLAAGDVYELELYPKTGGTAALINKQFTQYDSKVTNSFTLKVGSVNADGSIASMSYSLDGTNFSAVHNIMATADGRTIHIKGTLPDGNDYEFQLEIKNDLGNTINDQYTFKLPPGDAASDNAVRLAEFLKYGAKEGKVADYSKYMNSTDYAAALGNKSIDGKYNEDLGSLGVQTQTSYSMMLNQQVLVNQVHTVRSNYKDVSLDEEMTNMIMFQKGYNSNARMLTTIDEMLDKLINGTGRVGL